MASTPQSTHKSSTYSTPSTTSSAVKSSEHSSSSSATIQRESRPRGPSLDEDNDSGDDEWGVEIGNLIIDLDADVEKDEMKEKNDARNSNNNNSIKGSSGVANASSSQTSLLNNESVLNSSARADSAELTKSGKVSASISGSTPAQGSVKAKSKSKKSAKSSTMNKHGCVTHHGTTLSTPSATGRSDQQSGNDSSFTTTTSGGRSAKPESSSAKTNRSYKKHGKNNTTNDRKLDGGTSASKEVRDKSGKSSKVGKHQNQGQISTSISAYSMPGSAFTTPSVMGSLPAGANKGKRGNSPCPPNSRSSTPIDAAPDTTRMAAGPNDETVKYDKAIITRANEAPVLGTVAHLGKHRKTSSLPSPMRYPKSFGGHNPMPASLVAPSPLATTTTSHSESMTGQNTIGKRERNSNTAIVSAGNKKIKLEKEGKLGNSVMTPNDGDNIVKATRGSPEAFQGQLVNVKNEYKMTVGQQKLSGHDAKEDKKSIVTRPVVSCNSSTMHHPAKGGVKNASNSSSSTVVPGGKAGTDFPQNNVPTPSSQISANRRTIGTVTTYADAAVSTEPESLGPCEPGTSVHLNGIVWHETESGVLVVNVTWRNRSYVGTLLDATKHDWAPPRIPDVDSDTEYRVKSGRPKRHRGANGNGSEGGRKGRKSALASNIDEYKCSPSSNKRRSAKMSESDAYSGNDGEICTTPSKSAKRARLSRTAAAKQAAQKSVSATSVKESSGDGTSGSGSSACSSPVFMECSHANCKRRYNNDVALKYHESHAHQGDELEKNVEEESPQADSPKDSDNASTKSGEEMPVSDSSGSPNTESGQTAKETEIAFSMEAETVEPRPQAPFVVTQAQDASTEKFESEAFSSPKQSSMQSNFTKNIPNNEETRTRIERPAKSSSEFEGSEPNAPEPTPIGGAVSPYTLTDSQPNDSISLKTPVQMKQQSRPYGMLRPRPSLPLATESKEQSAVASIAEMEASSAVDNESAQAVQTLLKLQENSQDQLPGLTQYSQTSQAAAMSLPSQIESATTPPSVTPSPSQPLSSHSSPMGHPDKSIAGGHAKPQTPSRSLTPSFRGHAKDGGTLLPRMSVGVCSPRNPSGGYVVGSYSHGTVTASSNPERTHPPTGLKTVKVKTVPIPTDPQQMLTPSSQSNSVQNQNSANNAKNKKRKKPKFDSGKSPTEHSKPVLVNQATVRPTTKEDVLKPVQPALDQTRVKQEHQNHGAANAAGAHYRTQYDSQFHSVKQTPSVVKSEPSPQHPVQQAYVHPTTQHPQRQQAYLHQEKNGRDQAPGGPGNRNNNNKLTPYGTPQQRHVTSPILHDKGDSMSSRENRPRIAHVPPIQHGTSNTIPVRSVTPVDQYGQARYRRNAPTTRDSTPTPMNTQPGPSQRRSSGKDSTSPPPAADNRVHGSEGSIDSKRSAASGQRPGIALHPQLFAQGIFNQYAMSPLDPGTYQAQLMNDPRFQQHYENVIQQEIQKDQKKDERPDSHAQNSQARQKLTPSPSEHRHVRPNSPLRSDDRRDIPPREPYPPHGQQILPSNRVVLGPQQLHAARDSPVPSQGGYIQTPNKLSVAAAAPTVRGLSPRLQTTPPPVSGNRPSRLNSETERQHRREPSTGERPQIVSRNPVTPNRKPTVEGHPDQRTSSPDLTKQGPPPTSVYTSPGVPVQLPPGARATMPYYTSYQPAIIDPRMPPYPFPAAYAMFPGAHIFHGHWPPGAAPQAVPGGQEKTPSQSPHSMKATHERPSSVSRSPYRDESERRQRQDSRGRDGESYSNSKERRISEGQSQQVRKSTTPDPKAATNRNQSGDGNSGTVTPPMQRHLHTHHHIHEGFPPLITPHHQYPYPMAQAVIAGPEAAAAAATLAQYPKRELS